ncbi:CU044_5270 family protein [Micromonospora sp. NBC_01699]|uniref:CU044_5270 family protein n=1 Tax=Micromonospora sp. NBC_01699 TaxID=2975984 RepID=UPI002E2C6DE3|nr:CU044_5270 family protein [Micromonospora sp. NBC_01699]
MDEVRMIRDVLGNAPAPSAETMARARVALLAQARTDSAAIKLGNVEAPGRRRVTALRTRLAGRGDRPGARWWQWSLGGLGISAAVAVALVVPVILGPATAPGDASRGGVASLPDTNTDPDRVPVSDGDSAGTVLRLAAANARLGPALEVRPEQFIYRVVEEGYLQVIGDVEGDGPVARIWEGRRHEMWYTVDGLRSARLRITHGTSRTPQTPADAEAARELGYDLTAPPKVEEYGPAPDYQPPADCANCPAVRDPGELYRPTPAYLASLPTDPARLLDTLRQAVGDQNKHSADQEVFTAVLSLLREADPIVPPEVRAALYQAVALIPGVERVAGRVDLGGRQGIAIGRDGEPTGDETQREELVFDTAGRELLGFRTVQIRTARGIPAGTVASAAVLTFMTVDRVGEVR